MVEMAERERGISFRQERIQSEENICPWILSFVSLTSPELGEAASRTSVLRQRKRVQLVLRTYYAGNDIVNRKRISFPHTHTHSLLSHDPGTRNTAENIFLLIFPLLEPIPSLLPHPRLMLTVTLSPGRPLLSHLTLPLTQ